MNDAIASFSIAVYSFLIPIAWIGLVISLLVLVPMALYRGTRGPAGTGLLIASYLFGATTWTLGAAITFATYGWLGIFIGVMLFGVGVVPIAILASAFTIKSLSMTLSLIVMVAIVWGSRIWGMTLVESASSPPSGP